MNENSITFPHYLVLEDLDVVDACLPEGVTFHNHVLEIAAKEPLSLHVLLTLHQDAELTYKIGAQTTVDIIETRVLSNDCQLRRFFDVAEGVIMHMFNENNAVADYHLTFDDQGVLGRDCDVTMGYAELSDNAVDARYAFTLTGQGASLKLRMAALAKEQEQKHYTVSIEHQAMHTTGIMDNYGVVKDAGHLVIDGIGSIKKGMRGSASHQTNKIMVFDPACYASANPYLYIDEYDVEASHAAGVGKMDENHLYYLETRGLTKRQAMQLITYGYLIPVVKVIDNEMLRERFEIALRKVGA